MVLEIVQNQHGVCDDSIYSNYRDNLCLKAEEPQRNLRLSSDAEWNPRSGCSRRTKSLPSMRLSMPIRIIAPPGPSNVPFFFFFDLTHNAKVALTSYSSVINCGDAGNQSFKKS
jgi:hypothetical protein